MKFSTIGCQFTKIGEIKVDDFGKTNILGVYSAGDVTTQMHSAIAASKGTLTVAFITNELNTEAWSNN